MGNCSFWDILLTSIIADLFWTAFVFAIAWGGGVWYGRTNGLK